MRFPRTTMKTLSRASLAVATARDAVPRERTRSNAHAARDARLSLHRRRRTAVRMRWSSGSSTLRAARRRRSSSSRWRAATESRAAKKKPTISASSAPMPTRTISTTNEANSDSMAKNMEGVTGVWFGGGDQVLLTKALLGTRVEKAIHARYEAGAVIGGTSAGAAVMSNPMLTGEERHPGGVRPPSDSSEHFMTIARDNIELVPGLRLDQGRAHRPALPSPPPPQSLHQRRARHAAAPGRRDR